MKLINNIRFLLSGLLCISLFIGCSSKKNTQGTRAYHELTTRYNIYFNAEEAYNDILWERLENFSEDFTELLPFYPTPPNAEKSSPGGPFDLVVDKTGKAILEHSITAKPRRDPTKAQSQEYRQWLKQEEFNPFLKNVWMLRGKACVQNRDYDEALSVFTGMLRLYSHDQAFIDEIEIWLLRTYTEMERFYDAEKTAYALRNRKLPETMGKLFNEHYAYFLFQKKEYAEAIPYLQKAIAQEKELTRKNRWQFLLGQLYTATGDGRNAYQAFEKVKGLRTPFEITFNATLWQSGLASGEQQQKIMRSLQKMEQKINVVDSAAFLNKRHKIYLKIGNESLAQAFQPPRTETDSIMVIETGFELGLGTGTGTETGLETGVQITAMTGTAGKTDSISGNIEPSGAQQRFSQGRSLAENAALHRQWRARNGLWQPRTSGSAEMAAGTTAETATGTAIPFRTDKDGAHYLLLAFASGSADKNQLLFTTTDFNFSHFKLRRFDASYISLPGVEALQIEPFGSFEEASVYAGIMLSDSLFNNAVPAGVVPLIISEENLKLIWSEKRIEEYSAFLNGKLASTQMHFRPPKSVEKAEILEKGKLETEKIVSLGAKETKETRETRETAEALKRRLEENAAKALEQEQESTPRISRKQILKEQDRLRKEKIKQREKELKEKQRKREAELKQREKERKKQRNKK